MNNKKISINLTAVQYQQINNLSKKNGQTITDWVISHLPITQENNLNLNTIKKEIDKLKVSEKFSLPSLFGDEWVKFSKRSRLSMGRLFFNKVDSGEIDNIIFIGKNSANLAFYKKTR